MNTAVLAVVVLVAVMLMYMSFMLGAWSSYQEGVEEARKDDEEPIPPNPGFRRFYALRMVDETGVSGTGVPVEGVQFSDGWVVTHWLNKKPKNQPKTETWHNPGIEPFEEISGHGGKTRVVWVDGP